MTVPIVHVVTNSEEAIPNCEAFRLSWINDTMINFIQSENHMFFAHENSNFGLLINNSPVFIKSLHNSETSNFCSFGPVGWLVVLRINVDLAIFQPYLDLEAGDDQSLKIQVARPGIEPRSSCSASQELNHSAIAPPQLRSSTSDASPLMSKRLDLKTNSYSVEVLNCFYTICMCTKT